MKITAIETTVLRLPEVKPIGDGCQSVLLIRIRTDEGITGIGEVHTNPTVTKAIIDAPLCSVASRGLREILIGENPLEIGRLWDKMYQATAIYGRRGAVMHAISGIDIALWDILGKAMGQPIHRLLGGARAERFPIYASDLMPDTTEATAEMGQRHRAAGYRAMKLGWGSLGRRPGRRCQTSFGGPGRHRRRDGHHGRYRHAHPLRCGAPSGPGIRRSRGLFPGGAALPRRSRRLPPAGGRLPHPDRHRREGDHPIRLSRPDGARGPAGSSSPMWPGSAASPRPCASPPWPRRGACR